MDPGSILLLLSITILIGIYIAKPFFDRRTAFVTDEEQAASSLLAERDRVLEALRELDFDYQLGKIPEADYPIQRTQLLYKGAELIKQLDAIHNHNGKSNQMNDLDIEAAITARREHTENGPALRQTSREDDEIETRIAARRRDSTAQPAGFCPQCGHAVQKTDKFCSKCGATQ